MPKRMVKKPLFTTDETTAIQTAAYSVWNEVAYDLLTSVAEEKQKDINAVSIPRSHVLEIVLDADRTTEHLRREMLRAKKAGRLSVVTDDLIRRVQTADYGELIKMLKPVFQYQKYGL